MIHGMNTYVSLTLRLPPELAERLFARADAERRSRSAECVVLIENALDLLSFSPTSPIGVKK